MLGIVLKGQQNRPKDISYLVLVACEVVILILCKGLRLILRSEIFNIKKSFIWFWELVCCLQLCEYLLWVSILLFVLFV